MNSFKLNISGLDIFAIIFVIGGFATGNWLPLGILIFLAMLGCFE